MFWITTKYYSCSLFCVTGIHCGCRHSSLLHCVYVQLLFLLAREWFTRYNKICFVANKKCWIRVHIFRRWFSVVERRFATSSDRSGNRERPDAWNKQKHGHLWSSANSKGICNCSTGCRCKKRSYIKLNIFCEIIYYIKVHKMLWKVTKILGMLCEKFPAIENLNSFVFLEK